MSKVHVYPPRSLIPLDTLGVFAVTHQRLYDEAGWPRHSVIAAGCHRTLPRASPSQVPGTNGFTDPAMSSTHGHFLTDSPAHTVPATRGRRGHGHGHLAHTLQGTRVNEQNKSSFNSAGAPQLCAWGRAGGRRTPPATAALPEVPRAPHAPCRSESGWRGQGRRQLAKPSAVGWQQAGPSAKGARSPNSPTF